MKNSGSIVAIIAVSFLGLIVVLVGSLERRPVIVESSASANEFTAPESSTYNGDSFINPMTPQVTTVLVDNQKLIIGTDDGLFMMPLSGKKTALNEPMEPERLTRDHNMICLNTILPYGDYRYAGGYGLYKLDDSYATAFAAFYPGETVNTMMEFGDGLLVGTDRGLWYHCDEPIDETGCADTLLKSDIIVTALAIDESGLWVGTFGDGLFYFDGRDWRNRYLIRDTLALAFVNAIEYRYPYLWVGTDEGIFRYNGGRWAQMFAGDSSDVYIVTTIMSTPAATYIGTEKGLYRSVGDTLTEVAAFTGLPVAGLCIGDKGVIVATRQSGIFTFNGKEEIVSPEQLTFQDITGDNNEVLAGTVSEESFSDIR